MFELHPTTKTFEDVTKVEIAADVDAFVLTQGETAYLFVRNVYRSLVHDSASGLVREFPVPSVSGFLCYQWVVGVRAEEVSTKETKETLARIAEYRQTSAKVRAWRYVDGCAMLQAEEVIPTHAIDIETAAKAGVQRLMRPITRYDLIAIECSHRGKQWVAWYAPLGSPICSYPKVVSTGHVTVLPGVRMRYMFVSDKASMLEALECFEKQIIAAERPVIKVRAQRHYIDSPSSREFEGRANTYKQAWLNAVDALYSDDGSVDASVDFVRTDSTTGEVTFHYQQHSAACRGVPGGCPPHSRLSAVLPFSYSVKAEHADELQRKLVKEIADRKVQALRDKAKAVAVTPFSVTPVLAPVDAWHNTQRLACAKVTTFR